MADSRREAGDDIFEPISGAAVHEFPVYRGEFGTETTPPDPDCAPTGFAAYSTGEARARDGEIRVTATEFGIPLAVTIGPDELRRDPDDLAADLLRLCRVAAGRAGLARRRYLSELGVGEEALRLLGLPTPELVEQAELQAEYAHEYAPSSWLDR